MSKLFALVLTFILVGATLQTNGCYGDPRALKAEAELLSDATPTAKPIPTDIAGIKKELAATQDREARLVVALKHAEDDAIQTKIWVGVGACVLAGLVLVVIGIWTTRRMLVEIGIGAFVLAGLGAVLAWLVPYVLYIGLGIAVIAIGIAVYMLINREKAVKQIAAGVDTAADRIPEFRDNFKRIFNEHIDSNIDKVIKTVRGVV